MELELATVEWVIRKCRLYLSGLPTFTVMVDHQALVAILDKYTFDAIENPKIQRLKERLSPYSFTTVWRKGKDHAIPNALSRAPFNDPAKDDECVGTELNVNVLNFGRTAPKAFIRVHEMYTRRNNVTTYLNTLLVLVHYLYW